MKTVITPGVPEKAQYTCDLTGVPLRDGPVATITLRCGYGAPYDGDQFELHLSEKTAEVVLPLLRSLLLDGAPLEPHLIDALFPMRDRSEKPITRRGRAHLLAELEKLHRYRRKTLASVRRGLAESAAGKARDRGSFANDVAERPPAAEKGQVVRRRIAERRDRLSADAVPSETPARSLPKIGRHGRTNR